jgi:hypothetical protein
MDSYAQGHCFYGGFAKTWAQMQRIPTEFGIDWFFVNEREPIEVTRVSLEGGNGQLRLVKAEFVPGGSVGSGFTYDDYREAAVPEFWKRRIAMKSPSSGPPVRLWPLHPTGPRRQPGDNAWQLVVGVVPTTDNSSASRAVIHYTVGGEARAARGAVFLVVTRDNPQGCEEP